MRRGLLACAFALLAVPLAAADLRGAVGTVKITPQPSLQHPVYMAGFNQNRTALGIHDDLYARALVLELGKRRVALIAVDLIGLFKDDCDRVRARLRQAGIDEAIVSSTHTHAGPDTLGIWGPSRASSGLDPAYMRLVSDRVLEAVQTASARLQPVTLHAATGQTHNLTKDMRLPLILDETLGVLQGRAGGKPAFTMVCWASHPEGLGRKNRQLSADWCASAIARLESQTHAPAVYFNGAIGGLMTCLEVQITDPKTSQPAPPETFRQIELIGTAVADNALALIASAPPCREQRLEINRRELDIPMTNTLYRAAVTLGVLKRSLFRSGKPTMAMMAALAQPDIRTEVARWRIGDVELAAIPGELYPELAVGQFQDPREPNADFPDAPREPHVRGLLAGPHRWVIGLANDEIGYIIPKSQWDLNAPFCYGRQKPQYGEVNSIGPDAAPLIMQTLSDLCR